MSTQTLLLAFLGIFVVVFGGTVLVVRLQGRRPGPAASDDGRPRASTGPEASDAVTVRRLRQAGLDLTPAQLRRTWLRAAIAVAVVGLLMGGLGPGGLVFGGLLGYGTWRAREGWLDYRVARRQGEFLDQFTDALGVMANGVKSGQTVLQTLETVATDFPDPIRVEVQEVLQELRMGVPMDAALAAWAERMPLEDLEIATTALVVQRQTGGNVAEILETVADTIRQRNKLHKQIRTLTTQGRMSGWVLGLLPVGLFFAMFLIAPERTGLLISHPIGLLMTLVGVLLIGLGGYFIRAIVTIEV
ncbi:MAG: type II secretion system F family protein [Candidatus Sericytochromatia bacterium]|nr:type II secretion system F family protein [Candidatus Sericytochromatia bacterium]